MKLSDIFEEKPKKWGLRGDPYFWDYLEEQAKEMDMLTPAELEQWIKDEYYSLNGEEMTEISQTHVEQFAHGGMSSGYVCGSWWIEDGIPLLKSRLR